jgi:hypothetical protein
MENKVDVNKKVEELEAAAKKFASKDTVISIGGYEFTPAKLMIAFTIVSSILGGLYGVFETYKDYMGMKKKIAEYVTPDLTEMYEKLAVTDKKMDGIEKSVMQATDYTNNIKNDLKSDIRRLEGVVENVERSSKQSQRETETSIKEVQRDIRSTVKEIDNKVNTTVRDLERSQKQLEKEVDAKIKKSLDNPLNN